MHSLNITLPYSQRESVLPNVVALTLKPELYSMVSEAYIVQPTYTEPIDHIAGFSHTVYNSFLDDSKIGGISVELYM